MRRKKTRTTPSTDDCCPLSGPCRGQPADTSQDCNILDSTSRSRDEDNRPVSSQTRLTSNRCGGQPWIGTLADIASEPWQASGWNQWPTSPEYIASSLPLILLLQLVARLAGRVS